MMAWRRPGETPSSDSTMVRLLTYICVTQPQWAQSQLSSTPPRCVCHLAAADVRALVCSRGINIRHNVRSTMRCHEINCWHDILYPFIQPKIWCVTYGTPAIWRVIHNFVQCSLGKIMWRLLSSGCPLGASVLESGIMSNQHQSYNQITWENLANEPYSEK